MNFKILLVHILICLAIAGLVSYFSSAKWLATAFWVSAALYANGVIATVEDFRPGGFENPDGKETPSFVHGFGAVKYLLKSLLIISALIATGLTIQLNL
jgi:hypothetical protein